MNAENFRSLTAFLKLTPKIIEVDRSSLFCEVVVP